MPSIDNNLIVSMPKQQLQAERIRVLYKQVPSILLSNLLISSLLTVFLYQYTTDVLSLYWMIAVIIISIFRFILLKQYERKERDEKNMILWGWIFILTAFISGCSWGATSFLFLNTDNLVIMLFLLMTLTGITVGSSASLSNFVPSYYAFAIPTISPFAYVLASVGTTDFIILSMMLTVFLLLQLIVAKKNQKTLDESIILRNEKTNLIKELEEKKEKAELASSAKTRFLAAASHDLRQPIHAINLFLDILDERNEDEEQSAIVNKIKQSSLSLEGLLESLLDISKLDAGIIVVNKKSFPIQILFDTLQNEFTPIAKDKGLNIIFKTTSLYVYSDIQHIERILRNLISNAIRYTDAGKILIGCRRKTDSVSLFVFDTGIGIDKSQNKIVFEEFQQIDNPSRDKSKGLGLGLSIVERLTKLINTKIILHSEPNKGSAFSISLPRSLPDHVVESNNITHIHTTELSGKFIVIIDDDDEIRSALKLLLTEWGCTTQELVTIEDVKLKLQHTKKPDMILADYRLLNNETGVDVIREINHFYDDDEIPAAIITGDTAPERIKEANSSGYELLHKPVSGGKLRALLNSKLSSK